MSEEAKKTAPAQRSGAARNGSPRKRPSRQHPNRNLLLKLPTRRMTRRRMAAGSTRRPVSWKP